MRVRRGIRGGYRVDYAALLKALHETGRLGHIRVFLKFYNDRVFELTPTIDDGYLCTYESGSTKEEPHYFRLKSYAYTKMVESMRMNIDGHVIIQVSERAALDGDF